MKLAIILVVVLGMVMASSSVFAETGASKGSGDPIYLQYSGITGDVGSATGGGGAGKCSGIQLDSFQWGTGTQASGGGGGAGKVAVDDISITKMMDKTSPLLLQQQVSGKPGSAHIDFCRKAGGDPYAEYQLTNAMISSYQISAGQPPPGDRDQSLGQPPPGDRPAESFSINFTHVTFTFFYTNPDGKTASTSVDFDVFTKPT